MAEYGVTDNGFVVKPSEVIKDELRDIFKQSFGNIDVSEQSNFGVLIGLLTARETKIWEEIEKVYNTRDVNQASGIALDKIMQGIGMERLPATKTEVFATLKGENGTTIPTDHTVAKQASLEEFKLYESVTLDTDYNIEATFSITTVSDSTDYTLTINYSNYTYTSGTDATKQSIIDGLKSIVDSSDEPVNFIDNGETGTLITSDYETEFSLSLSSNMQFEEIGRNGRYLAVNPGSIQVLAGELTEIIDAVSGLDSVYNYTAGLTGRDKETDAQFRQRRYNSLTTSTSATKSAIRNALLFGTDNVKKAIIIENKYDSTDSEGRPGHCFESVVLGGDNEDIANTILQTKPIGINPYGGTTLTLKDSQDVETDISFTKPVEKYLWINIEAAQYSEETLPLNAEDEMKKEIAEWGVNEYNIGIDVIVKRIYQPIYTIPGIGNVTKLEVAVTEDPSTPPGSYSSSDIGISYSEVVEVAEERISVTIS